MKVSKKKKNKSRLLIVLGLVVMAAAGVLLAESLLQKDAATSGDEDYPYRTDIKTLLLIGLDTYEQDIDEAEYANSQQSDFLLLVTIDEYTGEVGMLQLNRDIMCEIRQLDIKGDCIGTRTAQLALSHTYGTGGADSNRNTVEAVRTLLNGVRIDNYIAITMDAVPALNDLIGGVEVDGTLLMGEDALSYVRARKELPTGTNLERMERQRKYIRAFWAKIKPMIEEDDSFPQKLFNAVDEYMETDCTVSQLEDWVNSLELTDEILTIDGESEVVDNVNRYWADEESIDSVVQQLFGKK